MNVKQNGVTHLVELTNVCEFVLQFCVSDVGTLSTLITPGTTGGPTDPAVGSSGRSNNAENPPDKPGGAVVAESRRLYTPALSKRRMCPSFFEQCTVLV